MDKRETTGFRRSKPREEKRRSNGYDAENNATAGETESRHGPVGCPVPFQKSSRSVYIIIDM